MYLLNLIFTSYYVLRIIHELIRNPTDPLVVRNNPPTKGKKATHTASCLNPLHEKTTKSPRAKNPELYYTPWGGEYHFLKHESGWRANTPYGTNAAAIPAYKQKTKRNYRACICSFCFPAHSYSCRKKTNLKHLSHYYLLLKTVPEQDR